MTTVETKPLLLVSTYKHTVNVARRQQSTLKLIILTFYLATSISSFLETNLVLEKARLPNAVDFAGRNETDAEIIVTELNSWKLTVSTVIEIVLCTYIGPLTDRYGSYRIAMLYLPIIGHIVNDAVNCVHVYYWNWSPLSAAFTECFLAGIGGGKICFGLLCASYVSRLSSVEERTAKLGIMHCVIMFASGSGIALSGYLQTYFGLMNGFLVCILLNALAIAVAFVFLQPIPEVVENEDWRCVEGNNVFSCIDVVRKKRDDPKQLMIMLSVFIHPLLVGCQAGESSVLYLYLRSQFYWSSVDYSIYSFCHMLVILSGTVFGVEILSRRLKLRDTTIGIAGCLLNLTCTGLMAIVKVSWQIYTVSAIGMFHLVVIATVISVASKCVEPYEYGKLNALFGLMASFTPIVYPIYNQVYRATIHTLPNAFFLVSMSIMFPTVILFSIMRIVSNRSEKLMKFLYEKTDFRT